MSLGFCREGPGQFRCRRRDPSPFLVLSENQGLGSDTGTPVTYDYRLPFNFRGALAEVFVELEP